MSEAAFGRYAPFIQEYIYRKKWADLRDVQVEACEAILDSDNHVIIASGTASGKTEAAFFPILSSLYFKPAKSIGVVYIGPLKALINDQFERLSGLLDENNIPVWPWHGDVSQSMKKQAMAKAEGVLQITPESLEALLTRRAKDASSLFSDLRFVVIDEIHALMGTDRGLQVICLLARLERVAGCSPRRVGLSATLNDYAPAMRYLASASGREAVAVGIKAGKRTVSLCVESFAVPEGQGGSEAALKGYNDFMYDNCHGKRCIIFANSRESAETAVAAMKRVALERGERDVFRVHHGSVSAALRRDAETALRDGDGPAVVAATLSLELGIDIGDLDSTIQLGAPLSCASFVQRLGRSGRRSGISQMMFMHLHEQAGGDPFESLPWDLLRIVAITQLYLEERWVEPFEMKPKPFSLLAHQTLAALVTHGELSSAELARAVLTLPAFSESVSLDEYRDLLRCMLERDYLGRMENGGVIVGLEGEKVTGHYSFFAVFSEGEAYRVHGEEGEIGTIDSRPAINEAFVLAGRSWKVQSVDDGRKMVYVRQVKAGRAPIWPGSGGNVHARVVQRMRQVLLEDMRYPYLRPNAAKLVERARELARGAEMPQCGLFGLSGGAFVLCPWIGTKALRAIGALLSHGLKDGLKVTEVAGAGAGHCLRISSDLSAAEFAKRIAAIDIACDDPGLALPGRRAPQIDKYDPMVPEELLRKAFLCNELDMPEAVSALRRVGMAGHAALP